MDEQQDEQTLARREAELQRKEEELAQREQQLEQAARTVAKNNKERLYDRVKIPLWLLDLIIAACFVAFFVVVALGAMKGRGMF